MFSILIPEYEASPHNIEMATKTTLTSRLARRLEVKRDGDTDVDMYLNKDNRPLPPSRRTYGPWEFVGLWMVTGSFNVGGW